MNNLPKVVTQLCPEQELNPRPVDRKCNALPVAPPRHQSNIISVVIGAAWVTVYVCPMLDFVRLLILPGYDTIGYDWKSLACAENDR